MDRIRSLDVTGLDIDADGVRDFVWPVSWREHTATAPLNAVATEFQAQHIRFIPGWYDDANRIHTDWGQLLARLAEASNISGDTAFTSLFQSTGVRQ